VSDITLPRAVVEQVREALVVAWQSTPVWQIAEARNALDAALAEQKPQVEGYNTNRDQPTVTIKEVKP
jgi:hypothetical protein